MIHVTRRRVAVCAAVFFLGFVTLDVHAQKAEDTPAPNYALAAQWTSSKVSKLVFDTTVTPRWLESSDRFWYAYQTRDGRRFVLVDPVKRSKTPLFDHVKMAATLTSLTRIPYDAQHLPFSTVRFVKNDTAFEFDVRVP
jgi:dipeptidyl-peptidase-4